MHLLLTTKATDATEAHAAPDCPTPRQRSRRGGLRCGRRIPKGWVATYGQVAAMAGLPRRARLVGYVLQHLDTTTDVPWYRVVNAKGEVSYTLSRHGSDTLQQRLLEEEGVEFDDSNRFDLQRFRWPE
jgi:methylated-DNA-protein-cysteine methyltransferase-like protein